MRQLLETMQEYAQYHHKLIEKFYVSPHKRFSVLNFVVGLLSWIGPKSFWCKTYYGLLQQVQILKRDEQPLIALTLLIHTLQKTHFWYQHTEKWWHLMQTAIMLAQDLQLNGVEKKSEPIHQLMNLCLHAPQPWQGYVVAYCFASLSLWSFEGGKINKAIHQVNLAIFADPSWGYPEYLLGWYGLSFEGIDSVSHFVKAIKRNWQFYQRLKQDPLCQKFPAILQEVKKYIVTPTMPISS